MIVEYPKHGSLTVLPLGSYIYTPFLNYNGIDSFKLKISYGNLESSVASYSILVKPINDVPVEL